ncbi:MAG TPA: CDP-glucose 4,6-dehydratase [Usitatibacter sp.]|nr:CDP-glucose 4,6-dehydratase [Usitatibacter sp.]
MRAEFWRGKRVFVTGHTGFKGSWLSLWLQGMGAKVAGYALEPQTDPNLFTLARVGEGMESTIGDVRDLAALRACMERFRPEIVFHLAAQSVVRLSYEEPVQTYATNVMGTTHLLESVRHCADVRAVVVVTGDKCYENHEWEWGYRENEPMGGHDPYSSSKGCSELITAAYRASFFHSAAPGKHRAAVASVRAGNVIGGGDWTRDRLIPDIMRSIADGRAVAIRNPDAVRPWQHVLEPLGGYLELAQHLWSDGAKFAEAWNFGPAYADCRPVRWIVERLAEEWGESAAWEIDKRSQPHEAHFLRLDSSKAAMRLGWQPRWNLRRALHAIVAWHRAHLSSADMRSLVLDQVREYESTDPESLA